MSDIMSISPFALPAAETAVSAVNTGMPFEGQLFSPQPVATTGGLTGLPGIGLPGDDEVRTMGFPDETVYTMGLPDQQVSTMTSVSTMASTSVTGLPPGYGANPYAVPQGGNYSDSNPALTSVLAFRAAGAETLRHFDENYGDDPFFHWTSTQAASGTAYQRTTYMGIQLAESKTIATATQVRAIRRIQVLP
jgi:hypothetical protein